MQAATGRLSERLIGVFGLVGWCCLLFVGSSLASAQEDPLLCEGAKENGIEIKWTYVPSPPASQIDDVFTLFPDGRIVWSNGTGTDTATVNQLDSAQYCELMFFLFDVLEDAPVKAPCTAANYRITYIDRLHSKMRTACWRRTERSDQISEYLKAFVRLNNTLPPDALD